MRRISLTAVVIGAVVCAYLLGRHNSHLEAAAHEGGQKVLYYIDPMHPSYKSAKPGIAPDCGMKLEPVYAKDAGRAASLPAALPAGAVRIDETTQQLFGIRIAMVEKSSGSRGIYVPGRVVPEDSRVYAINSGVDGFVRETHGDSVGARVRRDQTLATYYAPDIIPAASGFLAANERVPGAYSSEGVRSVQNYTDRLRNLGMSEAQIKELATSRKLPESIYIVAPVDGFVLSRSVSAGQHFSHEMEFYRIADLKRVWVVADVDTREAGYLHAGLVARITLRDSDRRLTGRVTDSLPESEAGGATTKLRLEVENPQFALRPGALVDVEVPVQLPIGVTAPLDGVVETGVSTHVYVERGPGVFERREVETGWRSADRVEIVKGLRPGERIVSSAAFLVDSESRLSDPNPAANTGAGSTAMSRADRRGGETAADD